MSQPALDDDPHDDPPPDELPPPAEATPPAPSANPWGSRRLRLLGGAALFFVALWLLAWRYFPGRAPIHANDATGSPASG